MLPRILCRRMWEPSDQGFSSNFNPEEAIDLGLLGPDALPRLGDHLLLEPKNLPYLVERVEWVFSDTLGNTSYALHGDRILRGIHVWVKPAS